MSPSTVWPAGTVPSDAVRTPSTRSNPSPRSTNRAAPSGCERDVVWGGVLDHHVELPFGREHEERVEVHRHAALRSHLVPEGLDAVGHRDAVAQQVLDAVGAGGRSDQGDGAVQDPDEIDRVVVGRIEPEQDRGGQSDRREGDSPGRHGPDELDVAHVRRGLDRPVELAVLDVEPPNPRPEVGADHELPQPPDPLIGRFPVRIDELDDRLPRGRGLEGRTRRELRGRDRRRGADRLLGARGEREYQREHRHDHGGGASTHRADDTAGGSLDWARRSRPGGRGRQRSRNVRTPQGRVLGNTQAGRPVESATENRPPRER